MSESLKPRERIRKTNEFAFIYKRGNRLRGRFFTVVYLPNNMEHSRIAVVASKRIGNAVERNRVKRRMRTLYRRNKHLLDVPLDLVFISKSGAAEADWPALQKEYFYSVKSAMRKSRLQ
jgi:ribonuclease P protein component